MTFSPLSHLIAIGVLLWLYVALTKAATSTKLRWARNGLIGSLAAWVFASSLMAYYGLYHALNERYLLLAIGSGVPLAVIISSSLLFKTVRELIRRFVEEVTLKSLTLIHVVRIAAVGTIYHYLVGVLPGHFIVPVGFPDFVIGLTAYSMSRRISTNFQGFKNVFLAWNLVGAAVFLLAQPLIQLSQPGMFQVYTDGPNTDQVFAFPMSIIPTFVAPMLLGLHIVAIVKTLRLWKKDNPQAHEPAPSVEAAHRPSEPAALSERRADQGA